MVDIMISYRVAKLLNYCRYFYWTPQLNRQDEF